MDKNSSRSWGSSGDFTHISRELAALSGNKFQRAISPYLRAIFPGIIETPNLDHLDRAGLDYVVWSEKYQFPVAVQVKGWEISAEKLGYSQVKQCEKSLLSLQEREDISVEKYIILHNRDHRSKTFRTKINALIKKHNKEGTAPKIEIWDRRTFLNNVFDSMKRKLLVALKEDAQRRSALNLDFIQSANNILPITDLPLSSIMAEANQYRLVQRRPHSEKIADPAQLILAEDEETELVLLTGEFGYGKTTAVRRALKMTDAPILYVPGASLDKTLSSTKDFLSTCLEETEFFDQFIDKNIESLKRVARAVALYLFSTRSSYLRLVIDGLDESPVLARPEGFQSLFNWLKDIDIPVVLTLRTEMWNARIEAFQLSHGMKAEKDKTRNQKFRLIKLLPWDDDQIIALTDRHIKNSNNETEQEHLKAFHKLVKNGNYTTMYGDIPRRPLFLQMILSSIANHGLPNKEIGKGTLFYNWIIDKIRRDITNPMSHGNEGRISLQKDDTPGQTIRKSWEVMITAAGQMTQQHDDQLELTETCTFDDILDAMPTQRHDINDLGLFLNSLLLPANKSSPINKMKVYFAHRSFQEFFLAWHILTSPEEFNNQVLPSSVQDWITTLQNEALV